MARKKNNSKKCIYCEEWYYWDRTRGVADWCSSCDTPYFIHKAKLVHGNKYDYSKVEYEHSKEKVIIICPKHGEFRQNPNSHLSGNGCSKCSGMAKSNTKEFIKKARKIHKDKYDYSKVEYVNALSKVTIICPEHGEFRQKPNSHLSGNGCSKCSGMAKSNTEEFIKKARKIHKDKYDYSKVDYKHKDGKVIIICPKHGEFHQAAKSHVEGRGCQQCAGNMKSNTQEFIKKARKVHGKKYDYSKVEYINSVSNVKIICPKHGMFEQTSSSHLIGNGCSRCSGKAKRSTEEFIEEAIAVHGKKYDYSKVEYKNTDKKVGIICPVHGLFQQTPYLHLKGQGCPKCKYAKHSKALRSNTKEFIEKARRIHGNNYDYSLVDYKRTNLKVIIICPEHGEFLQTPHAHLSGRGCQKCGKKINSNKNGSKK